MNPLPRLRQRLADEDAVWRALRQQAASHVNCAQAALAADPPDVVSLREAGLAAVSAAYGHWGLPTPPDLAAAAETFARIPDAGDALVGTAMGELAAAEDLGTAAEGLELVLDWTWAVLRQDARDLSALAAAGDGPGASGTGRTRRMLLAGARLGVLVTVLLLADPFDWFDGGRKKRRQKSHRPKKGRKAPRTTDEGAESAGVADSPPATREGQKR
jgi:hypothetical protein